MAGADAWATKAEAGWCLRAPCFLLSKHIRCSHAANDALHPALLAAAGLAESRLDSDARSRAGAVGLVQLVSDTARFIARTTGGAEVVPADLRDPEIDVRRVRRRRRLGACVIRRERGRGNADEWCRRGRGSAFPETQAYVRALVRVRSVYANAHWPELGLGRAGRPLCARSR